MSKLTFKAKNYFLSDGYKFNYFSMKRRMPTCYLLTSKSIITFLIVISVYFLTMDITLFIKARNRGAYTHKMLVSDEITAPPPEILNVFRQQTTLKTSIAQEQLSKSSNNPSLATKSENMAIVQQQQQTISRGAFGIFSPLPVKKIMMAEATHYIRSPLSELLEYSVGFSDLFPFVTANGISFLHAVMSVVSVRFLMDDSLFWRQVGVVIFQARNFLDSFDGVIYRAHAKKSAYRSHYGSMGYFVDAFSDVFGGICLVGSIAIYLLRHPPPSKNLTRCFRLIDGVEQSFLVSSLLSASSKSKRHNKSHHHQRSSSYQQAPAVNKADFLQLSLSNSYGGETLSSSLQRNPTPPSSPSSSSLCSSSSESSTCSSATSLSNSPTHFLLLSPNKSNNPVPASHVLTFSSEPSESAYAGKQQASTSNNCAIATKPAILISVALLGIRLAVSALFWDRSVHTYEDMLDSPAKSDLHQQIQINVLRSTITLFIMMSWRVMCALSLQDLILTAIFINKTWEFVVKSQLISWILLIGLIILTELHVAEIHSIIKQAY